MRPALKYALPATAGLLILCFAVTRIIGALRTDESRVRLVFKEVAEYARARDAGGVLEYLDPEYRDPQGFAAPEIRRLVRAYLANAESVEAELDPMGIEGLEVEGDEVDVLVRARARLQMPGAEDVTLDDGGIHGEYIVVGLRRHESYFRARSVRPAGPGLEGMRTPPPAVFGEMQAP